MSRFYFTYGNCIRFPFRGGWTVVEAETIDQAESLFRAAHPDRNPGVLNCAGIYTEADFKRTKMFANGSNFGAGLHEFILLAVDRA